MEESNIDYDEIPVCYCEHCLSLRIMDIPESGVSYCDECGSTDILETDIHTWEKMYEQKYGKKFIDTDNGRD